MLGNFLSENADVRMVFLPKESPYLNPVEAYWQKGKRELLVLEYYETFAMMCAAVSGCYLTVRFNLNLYSYRYRPPSKNLINF